MEDFDSLEEAVLGIKRGKKRVNSKRKGIRNEYAVAQYLSKWTGQEFVRIPASGGLRWKNAQNICGDLLCTNLDYKFPFAVETKHLKNGLVIRPTLSNGSHFYKVWVQAKEDAERASLFPMIIVRHNGMKRQSWYVGLDASTIEICGINKNMAVATSSPDAPFDLYIFESAIFAKYHDPQQIINTVQAWLRR